jgi:predicted Ser/Thr protein kinase
METTVQVCPTCRQHFSGDARFCPFDGDPLEASTNYRPEADPLLGKLIDGRYLVEVVLGEGGMGSVYRVRHRALDKCFALKVMRADFARQGDLAARFIQEARAAAAIGHQNIVQITDFGQLPSGAPYFVMELLEGEPLARMIRRGGPLPAGRAVRILQQAASALAAAHKAGVIHRDLKPDNIHVGPKDMVKILDFGVAKMAGAGRLTRTGMVFGTPHYMSPEQASGGDVDHRADIYALGIIMYEMFTGRVPFEADSYMGVLTKHMYMVPEPPSRVSAAARELGALEDVTLRCLEKKPEARFRSMDELVLEIESVVHFRDDDDMEIRPSALPSKPRVRVVQLADELEPPGRDELKALRPEGIPALPAWVIGVGIAAGVFLAMATVYGLTRGPKTRASPATAASGLLVAPLPAGSVPSASLAACPTVTPLASAPELVPVPASTVGESVGTPSSRARPERSKSRPTDHPRARPAAPAPSARAAFGAGEIVNPWDH